MTLDQAIDPTSKQHSVMSRILITVIKRAPNTKITNSGAQPRQKPVIVGPPLFGSVLG